MKKQNRIMQTLRDSVYFFDAILLLIKTYVKFISHHFYRENC